MEVPQELNANGILKRKKSKQADQKD